MYKYVGVLCDVFASHWGGGEINDTKSARAHSSYSMYAQGKYSMSPT